MSQVNDSWQFPAQTLTPRQHEGAVVPSLLERVVATYDMPAVHLKAVLPYP